LIKHINNTHASGVGLKQRW